MSVPSLALPGRLTLVSRVGAYVALTKPRIIELLLITTLPTMILAKGGLPGVWLMIATLLGGALAAGGANAINMYVDRDIDKLMHRTRKRPLVTGVISPRNALIFAVTLEVVAFVELWAWVNLLSIYARDIELLLGRWTCVGHASEIPNPGDYFVTTLGLESAIIVRGADGEIRALNDVCRHRGSRLCVEARGNAAMLTCPYHAWTYHLDGRLRAAREMPPGFDPTGYDLKALPVAVIAGLILISFGASPGLVVGAFVLVCALGVLACLRLSRRGWL